MKGYTVASKTVRQTTDCLSQHSSADKDALAFAPPDYGIDFVDQGLGTDPVQRQPKPEEEKRPLQGRFEVAPTQMHQEQAESSPNRTGMPDGLKAGIESLSGMDLSDVRVHANSNMPAQINALAYAQCSDIHLGPGQESHLPHEAWHIVQQRQGRVQPTMQMRGRKLNADSFLEHEADVMGARALQGDTAPVANASTRVRSTIDTVIQPRLGFEIEMLALVDINGRPIPEKTDLGTIGVHNLEMTVDHGPAVAAQTPTPAYRANFSIPGMAPGPAPLLLGPYDTPLGTDTRMAFVGGAVGVDPRAALVLNLLAWGNWAAATAGVDRARIANPDNRPIVQIDQILQQYDYQRIFDNYERGPAQLVLAALQAQIAQWHVLNPNANTRFGRPASNARRTARYNAANAQLVALNAEAVAHSAMWLANPAPPVGMAREYRQGGPMAAWNPAHPQFQPQEGMGTDRYASILELVTPGGAGYEPETPGGRANIIAAVTEAVNFATALEAATGNFANRALLSTVAGVNNVTNPLINVGNPLQPNQTTDASIQSTMAIDLAQMASFFKSTVAAANRSQLLFELKHHSDPVGPMGVPMPPRSETAMARAPIAARNIIRNRLNLIPGWAGNVSHLRGLITLIAQYLLMGQHFYHPGALPLDKNIVPLLSRNDLGSVIFAEMVPPAERPLVATALLRAPVIAAILAETNRVGAMAVFGNAADNVAPAGAAPYNLSCTQFITNVLSGLPDGITGNLGGFRQFPHGESVDPLGARGGDYRRAGPAQREGAIFELRNMIPSQSLGLPPDRFPHNQWVTLAPDMCNLLAALNARTVAASATDTRYRQATGLLQNEAGPW